MSRNIGVSNTNATEYKLPVIRAKSHVERNRRGILGRRGVDVTSSGNRRMGPGAGCRIDRPAQILGVFPEGIPGVSSDDYLQDTPAESIPIITMVVPVWRAKLDANSVKGLQVSIRPSKDPTAQAVYEKALAMDEPNWDTYMSEMAVNNAATIVSGAVIQLATLHPGVFAWVESQMPGAVDEKSRTISIEQEDILALTLGNRVALMNLMNSLNVPANVESAIGSVAGALSVRNGHTFESLRNTLPFSVLWARAEAQCLATSFRYAENLNADAFAPVCYSGWSVVTMEPRHSNGATLTAQQLQEVKTHLMNLADHGPAAGTGNRVAGAIPSTSSDPDNTDAWVAVAAFTGAVPNAGSMEEIGAYGGPLSEIANLAYLSYAANKLGDTNIGERVAFGSTCSAVAGFDLAREDCKATPVTNTTVITFARAGLVAEHLERSPERPFMDLAICVANYLGSGDHASLSEGRSTSMYASVGIAQTRAEVISSFPWGTYYSGRQADERQLIYMLKVYGKLGKLTDSVLLRLNNYGPLVGPLRSALPLLKAAINCGMTEVTRTTMETKAAIVAITQLTELSCKVVPYAKWLYGEDKLNVQGLVDRARSGLVVLESLRRSREHRENTIFRGAGLAKSIRMAQSSDIVSTPLGSGFLQGTARAGRDVGKNLTLLSLAESMSPKLKRAVRPLIQSQMRQKMLTANIEEGEEGAEEMD